LPSRLISRASSIMRRLFIYVAIVALLVAAAVWLANDPGTVALEWRGWRVDTSVGLLITSFIITVVVVLTILRLVAAVSGTVRAYLAAQREKRLQRGLTSLGDGFAAVQAGQVNTARRLAKEAASLLSDSSAVLVLRKEAAALGGDLREMQAAAMAMLARPETELAGLRALANKALADGDVVGALGHARKALGRKDTPAWAVRMVIDAEIATERWSDALSALDSKLGREAFAREEHARLMGRLLVRQAETALRNGDAAVAAVSAKKAMGAGGHTRDAVVVFAKAMAAQGKGRKAAGTVERAWAEAPHIELLSAYRTLVPAESSLDWAKRIESLVKGAPDHTESKLAVAEASLHAELWGQARNRLSGLTAETVDPETRARAAHLLAELETRQRGDAEAAADWLKIALEFHRAPPRPPRPQSAAELLAQA
jgi:HemY protein